MTEPVAHDSDTLQIALRRIIQTGRDRCGLGFGKYPLGVRDALEELKPFMSEGTLTRLADFTARLADMR